MPARRASVANSDGGQPTAAQELFAPGGDDQYDQEIDPSRRVRFHTDSSRPKSKSPLPSPRRRKKAASAGDVIQTFGLEFGERSRSIQDLLEDISAARRVRKPSGAYSMKLPMLEDVVVPPPGGDKAIFSKISQKELARLRADIAKNVEVSLRERGWKAADKVGRRLEGGPGKNNVSLSAADAKPGGVPRTFETNEERKRMVGLTKDLEERQHPAYVNRRRKENYRREVEKRAYAALLAEAERAEAETEQDEEIGEAAIGYSASSGEGRSRGGSGTQRKDGSAATIVAGQINTSEVSEVAATARKPSYAGTVDVAESRGRGAKANRDVVKPKPLALRPPKLLPLPKDHLKDMMLPDPQWKTNSMSTRGASFDEMYPWRRSAEKKQVYDEGWYAKQSGLKQYLDQHGRTHEDPLQELLLT
eukprot:g8613.t1